MRSSCVTVIPLPTYIAVQCWSLLIIMWSLGNFCQLFEGRWGPLLRLLPVLSCVYLALYSQNACVCQCLCVCVCVCVCARAHALRIVSRDKIWCFKNIFIIIIICWSTTAERFAWRINYHDHHALYKLCERKPIQINTNWWDIIINYYNALYTLNTLKIRTVSLSPLPLFVDVVLVPLCL